MDSDRAAAETADELDEPAWRKRAVARSLNAARARAEDRAQRFLDAAFELIDEKGTTDFTIQEVIDRSKQSLRGFYQHFDGKDELLLALFEDSMLESAADLRDVVATETDPIDRLRAFTIRLHEWCDPPRHRASAARTTGARSRSSRCSSRSRIPSACERGRNRSHACCSSSSKRPRPRARSTCPTPGGPPRSCSRP